MTSPWDRSEQGRAIVQSVGRNLRRHLRLTAGAALIGAFAFAFASAIANAAAPANSLVYIKGGTPYISATDGSDAHVVTNDQPGQWSLVTATDTGTVFAGRSDGWVQAYAPGGAGTNESVSSGLQMQDLDVAPDGSALAWMILTHSQLDPSELVHDTEVQQLTGGSGKSSFALAKDPPPRADRGSSPAADHGRSEVA